jgi:hypothetical protein
MEDIQLGMITQRGSALYRAAAIKAADTKSMQDF